jgi:chromosome segregation ATPase
VQDRSYANCKRNLTKSLLSRDHALEQDEASVAEEKNRAGLELRELQAKLDGLVPSRDQAEANAAEAKKRCNELQAGLDELQARLDELMLSRDEHPRTPEQARSALQKATSHAADADERSQPAWGHATELSEVHAELEGKKSELATVYDSRTRRMVVPRARQRKTHCVPDCRRSRQYGCGTGRA